MEDRDTGFRQGRSSGPPQKVRLRFLPHPVRYVQENSGIFPSVSWKNPLAVWF